MNNKRQSSETYLIYFGGITIFLNFEKCIEIRISLDNTLVMVTYATLI